MADKGRRSQLGVKLPSPSGLHFESGGGFVAGSRAGPPGELSSPGTIAWGEKWQKKAHQPVILPPWEGWEALALWKGSIIHEVPHKRLYAPASAGR